MKSTGSTQARPLSDHARIELQDIARKPIPRQSVNPGVVDRLLRESLVECYEAKSPFPTHNGKLIEHLRITNAGRAAVSP